MVTKNRRSQRFKHVDGFALKSSSTDKNDVVLSTLAKEEVSSDGVSYMLDSASDVVTSFYDGINSRDLSRVVDLIAEDCVYEDLVFPKPIVGRKAILEFFEKFIYTIRVLNGKPFPFSKGCSFYRLQVFNRKRKIVYGRDIVEPAVKPGDFALVRHFLSLSLLICLNVRYLISWDCFTGCH
nr:hypothetical protein [Tanacetum cinerariifolium]